MHFKKLYTRELKLPKELNKDTTSDNNLSLFSLISFCSTITKTFSKNPSIFSLNFKSVSRYLL